MKHPFILGFATGAIFSYTGLTGFIAGCVTGIVLFNYYCVMQHPLPFQTQTTSFFKHEEGDKNEKNDKVHVTDTDNIHSTSDEWIDLERSITRL